VLAPGDGKDPVQFIDARDLAEWTIRMAEQRGLGVFHATGPARELTMAGLLQGIGAAIHANAKPIWIPADFLDAQKVVPWSDMPVWVPGQGDSAGFTRLDLRKAIGAGLTYRPLAQTAVDTLAWFRQQPAERQARLHAGLDTVREAAVLEVWKAKHAAA
jgi:2'-hydroxyisoflavone reductase